jgi:hypothetical protein
VTITGSLSILPCGAPRAASTDPAYTTPGHKRSVCGLSFVMLYATAQMLSRRSAVTPQPDEPAANLPEERPIPMPAHLATRDEMVG